MAARAQTEPTLAKQIVSLIERMRHPLTGVPVRDRSRLLRAYKSCFVGAEIVSWLLFQRLGVATRPDAVQLLRLMMTRGVFYPLTHTNKRQFRDSTTSFYRFYVDDDGFHMPYELRGSEGSIVERKSANAAQLHEKQPSTTGTNNNNNNNDDDDDDNDDNNNNDNNDNNDDLAPTTGSKQRSGSQVCSSRTLIVHCQRAPQLTDSHHTARRASARFEKKGSHQLSFTIEQIKRAVFSIAIERHVLIVGVAVDV
jgi:hypothetical protein